MALTITEQFRTVFGDRRIFVGTAQFDSSYPTGGEAVAAADFGMTRIDYINPIISAHDRKAFWDSANSTLELTVVSTGAQAANASDQSAFTADIIVIGA